MVAIKVMSNKKLAFNITTKLNDEGYSEQYDFYDLLGAKVSNDSQFESRLLEIFIYNKLYIALPKKQVSGCLCMKEVQDPKERSLQTIKVYCDTK